MRKNILLIMLLSVIISVGLLTGFVSGAATYTETAPSVFPVLAPTVTWNPYNITADKGVPFNAVAEIVIYLESLIEPETVGVREVGSSNARYLLIAEAEGSGKTHSRFLVNVNGSGIIEIYGSRAGSTYSGFMLVGYWTDANFTEQWESYQVTVAEDDMWHETDGTELDLQANNAHLITIGNAEAGNEYTSGVRNTTSVLPRYIDIMEAEGGGTQTASMFVVADANSKIDVYSAQYNDITFYNQGFFDDSLEFHENWGWIWPNSDGWVAWDLSTLMDQPGRVVDFVLSHADESNQRENGIRTNGSSAERRFDMRESEGGGYSCLGISAQSDANGVIELYQAYWILGSPRFSGYFTPGLPSVTVEEISLLFGAGFNHSSPYIYFEWNHSGIVDNYEIQHSTDGISYSFLAYTTQKNYNHSSLVYGDYHYYKVRATYWNVAEWVNSSYATNLERVWFILGADAPGTGGLYWMALASLIIILASLLTGGL